MTKKELCKFIGITEQAYYKWKKEKPNLFMILENYRTKEDQYSLDNKLKELNKYFQELTEEEKEMYIAEIKARALRKKLK